MTETRYKDSGIPWIGKIPSDWEVRRARDTVSIIRGGSPRPIEDYISGNNEGYNWIKIGDTIKGSKYIVSTKSKIIEEGLNKTRFVHKDDLILTNSMSFGEPYILKIDGCIHDGWVAFSNYKDITKEFLYYLLISPLCRLQFEQQVAGGVVQNLNIDKIGTTQILLPPLPTQQRIADFLDRKCAEIDELAALQETMIAELKRYKQSVITEAVTKGLDPDVPMKDSGVEWIGEIPSHWEVKRAKHIANIVRGGSPRPAGDERYYNGDIPFMKVADITKDDNVYVNSCEYTIKEAGLSNTRSIDAGTLLLTNSGATLGVPKINTFPTTFNDGIAAFLNLSESIDILFAYYSLKARTKHFLEAASLGIGQPNLNTDIIGNTIMLLPPLTEQRAIADYLDRKCAEIDELIAIKQQKIEALKEYKKSVIFEYVTGKKEI